MVTVTNTQCVVLVVNGLGAELVRLRYTSPGMELASGCFR